MIRVQNLIVSLSIAAVAGVCLAVTGVACSDSGSEGAGQVRDAGQVGATVDTETSPDASVDVVQPEPEVLPSEDAGMGVDAMEPEDDAALDVDTELLDSDAGASDVVQDDDEPAVFGLCPTFQAGRSRGYISSQNVIEQLASPVIVEASGIAASRIHANVIYTHNDSGGNPEIFAVNTTNGHRLATFQLSGATNRDWEDIAVGPGPEPGRSYIYVGDIGDNSSERVNVTIYRVPEPASLPGGGTPPSLVLDEVERLELRYPDRGNNAETMMVDPQTGDIYIVGKSGRGTSPVYRGTPPFLPQTRVTMELVTTLQFGSPPLDGAQETTAGDFSGAGDLIAIRTYNRVYVWRRPAGRTVAEAFASEPCPAPQFNEPQGEAICFDVTSGGYYTLSEGRGQQLYYFAPQ